MFNDCEEPKKNNDWLVYVLICVSMVVLICFGIYAARSIQMEKEYNLWYNNLSKEEQAEVDAQKQAEYDSKVFEYDVLNLSKFIWTETNMYGGIMKTEIRYTFSYVDNEGKLQHEENFHSMHIEVGEEDKFVIDKNEGSRRLYLTKETLNNIQVLTSG